MNGLEANPRRAVILIILTFLMLVTAATACVSGAAAAPQPTKTPNALPPLGYTVAGSGATSDAGSSVVVSQAAEEQLIGQQVAYNPATNAVPQNLTYPVNFSLIRDLTVPDCNTVLQYGIPAGVNWWISGRVNERAGCRIVVGSGYTDVILTNGLIYSVTIMPNFERASNDHSNPNRYADCNSALAGAAYYLDNVRLSGALEYAVGCEIYQTGKMKLIALDDGRTVFFTVSG